MNYVRELWEICILRGAATTWLDLSINYPPEYFLVALEIDSSISNI